MQARIVCPSSGDIADSEFVVEGEAVENSRSVVEVVGVVGDQVAVPVADEAVRDSMIEQIVAMGEVALGQPTDPFEVVAIDDRTDVWSMASNLSR